jgi:hypothetical protein
MKVEKFGCFRGAHLRPDDGHLRAEDVHVDNQLLKDGHELVEVLDAPRRLIPPPTTATESAREFPPRLETVDSNRHCHYCFPAIFSGFFY